MGPAVLKPFPRFLFALFVCPCVMGVALALLQGSGAAAAAYGQTQNMTAGTGSQPVFRLDGGNTTYVFGVNERGELQQIYWGGRLGEHDVIGPAKSEAEQAAMDSSYNNTPQEYAGWGSGLYLEPALKVTFADGSRDLVLHYASSSKQDDHSIDVVVKDISRALMVTCERWLCAPRSEIFFEQGHRLVTGTTTLTQVWASPRQISPISEAL